MVAPALVRAHAQTQHMQTPEGFCCCCCCCCSPSPSPPPSTHTSARGDPQLLGRYARACPPRKHRILCIAPRVCICAVLILSWSGTAHTRLGPRDPVPRQRHLFMHFLRVGPSDCVSHTLFLPPHPVSRPAPVSCFSGGGGGAEQCLSRHWCCWQCVHCRIPVSTIMAEMRRVYIRRRQALSDAARR